MLGRVGEGGGGGGGGRVVAYWCCGCLGEKSGVGRRERGGMKGGVGGCWCLRRGGEMEKRGRGGMRGSMGECGCLGKRSGTQSRRSRRLPVLPPPTVSVLAVSSISAGSSVAVG